MLGKTFHLLTFCQSNPKQIATKTTSFGVHLRGGFTQHITAHIVPHVTGQIQWPKLDFTKWKLWQSMPKSCRIVHTATDVLIGNDFILDIVLPKWYELQEGLYLLESKLGWTVTGRIASNGSISYKPRMVALNYGTALHTAVHQTMSLMNKLRLSKAVMIFGG